MTEPSIQKPFADVDGTQRSGRTEANMEGYRRIVGLPPSENVPEEVAAAGEEALRRYHEALRSMDLE